MPKITLTNNLNEKTKNKILSGCGTRWLDSKEFLNRLWDKARILAYVKKEGDIVAFTIANYISDDQAIGINFLATRISFEYQKKGLGTKIIKKIINNFIIRNKLLKINNWFKPFYFVSITANPIAYKSLVKNLEVTPNIEKAQAKTIEKKLANKFVSMLGCIEKFDPDTFTLSHFFLDSAEIYKTEDTIPWTKEKSINNFLEDKLHLREKQGNGLVVVSKIM